jgi:hypothetical protein
MVRTIRDALIAIFVERSVNWFVPQFLPYAWLIILTWLTWDVLRTKPLKNIANATYLRWGKQYPMWTYVIIFAVGGTLLSIYWAGITGALAFARNRHDAGTAEISPPPHPPKSPVQDLSPRFTERFDRFTIHYGGARLDINNKDGTKFQLLTVNPDGSVGMGGNPDEPRSSNDEARLVVTVNDNQLFIDADLFTSPGEPPMRVRRNEISGRPLKKWEDPGWDKQSSESALEIVNQDRFPVLQILYLDNAQVIVNGVFVSGERATILTNERTVVAQKSELNEFLKHFPIKRLFKYPAWKYKGLYEDESSTRSPTLDAGATPP